MASQKLLCSSPFRFAIPKRYNSTLNFDDFQNVYKFRSTPQLLRSYAILRLCGINLFVDNSLNLMNRCQSLFGTKLFSLVTRPTFYDQFVGGDTKEELQWTVDGLNKANVRLMVCPVQEEDLDTIQGKYDDNLDYIKNAAGIMASCDTTEPNLQFKVTAFMPATIVTKLTSIIATKKNKSEIVNQLQKPFRNESLGQVDGLNIDENAALEEGLERCKTLADFALPRGLKLLVDAEYTYMNDGISVVALAMMKHYNISEAKIGNTYQCYLKQALNTITEELEIVTANGQAKFGAKIVRGAYLEKERKLAQSQGYPDPVNDTYQATGEMYQKVIGFLLERSNGYTVIATHNEDAVGKIAQKLRNDEEKRQGKFVFAQIYGMGEQITMPLANDGFTVYKSVPYGPLEEVLPYLSRRVSENRAVLSGARKERDLLVSELRRRVLN